MKAEAAANRDCPRRLSTSWRRSCPIRQPFSPPRGTLAQCPEYRLPNDRAELSGS
jgi:hypothetical protein